MSLKNKFNNIWMKWKKIYHWFNIISWMILGVVIIVELSALAQGYYIFPFYSDCCGSMYPTFKDNSLCIAGIKSLGSREIVNLGNGTKTTVEYFPDEENIKIGGIVKWKYYTFDNIVHRVISYCPEDVYPYRGIVTKGDNLNQSDSICVPWWAISEKLLWIKCL